jgi:hypothetical protein
MSAAIGADPYNPSRLILQLDPRIQKYPEAENERRDQCSPRPLAPPFDMNYMY